MANIGYIQVVRHCNHFCGFCSNPSTAYTHTFETMARLVDDLVERGYFGVVLTGGEPTLHPELPRIVAHARERGLHVRMITNGWRLAEEGFARELAQAGLELVHVSIYSVHAAVEERIRGVAGTLDRAHEALDNAGRFGIEANVNCVINRLNADHLDENVKVIVTRHPHVRHFVWNNLDPSMGRAEVNQDQFTPHLADFELSLTRALRILEKSGRTFRVERVPLCYMTDFAWASTETRKIVKGEERVVHFLDAKQTVRQTDWEHVYTDACAPCSLRPICGGLFDRGEAYDPAELAPVFVPMDPIVQRIISDPSDPSYPLRSLEEWRPDFARRLEEARKTPPRPKGEPPRDPDAPPVGLVTEESLKKYARGRAADERRAARAEVELERIDTQTPEETSAKEEP
ncbi:MAG: radical SAM protein [Myxococcales bacterium]|nr:radical SAM protein [Myxococcales bacterium]